MGPYHYARMNALNAFCSLHVFEATARDDHHWENTKFQASFTKKTLLTGRLGYAVKTMFPFTLLQQANWKDYDVVVNGCGFSNPLLNSVMRSIPRSTKKVLWSESTRMDNPASGIKDLVKRQVLKTYDGAIVAGKLHRAYLERFGMPSQDIHEVGNVVENRFFSSNASPKKKGANVVEVLTVARFLNIKYLNFITNLAAWAQEKNLEMLHFKIVGDGPEFERIQNIISEKQLHNITLTGNLTPKQVALCYQEADVFLLPSLSEPWGLVVNEAMASGLPIIVSDRCGCVPELVHPENGIVFDPLQFEAFIPLFESVIFDSEKRLAMGRAGKKRIQEFTPAKYAQKCASFFENLI